MANTLTGDTTAATSKHSAINTLDSRHPGARWRWCVPSLPGTRRYCQRDSVPLSYLTSGTNVLDGHETACYNLPLCILLCTARRWFRSESPNHAQRQSRKRIRVLSPRILSRRVRSFSRSGSPGFVGGKRHDCLRRFICCVDTASLACGCRVPTHRSPRSSPWRGSIGGSYACPGGDLRRLRRLSGPGLA